MALDIHKLIAAVSPDVFCDASSRKKIKEIVKNSGYQVAAKAREAKPIGVSYMDLADLTDVSDLMNAPGLKAPKEQHLLIYDAFSESLEPIYFWVLDMMSRDFRNIDKIVDNFVASPGSGHFSESGMKLTKMQDEGMKILGGVNQVVKSILNVIYDLKEFQMRLHAYDAYRSKDPKVSRPASYSLKQVWMDTVDAKKGNSALLMFARQFDYATLIDAFMTANSVEDVTKSPKDGGIDLNDRVRRILQQRLAEFYHWIDVSETELKKRFEIEKIYLRSQVATAKMYARWAKPYLKSASQLEQRGNGGAALVNQFNTAVFGLVLLGATDYEPDDDIEAGDLPKMIKNAPQRKYSLVLIMEFNFRSVPERTQQGGYGFRGKAEVKFTSYALNEEEIKIIKREIDKDDVGDMLGFIENATDDSLAQLQVDIDSFLVDGDSEDKKKAEEDKKKKESDTNPFSELFSIFKSKKKEKKSESEDPKKIPAPDNQYEKVLRSQAAINGRLKCYKLYDRYKKTHGMPSLPYYTGL